MENIPDLKPPQEKIKIRGLVRIAGWIFISWGSLVAITGLYHSFFGEPEANYYSPAKWDFVTEEQWLRWSGFEITYGLACIGIALLCWEYAKILPDWILREKKQIDDFLK